MPQAKARFERVVEAGGRDASVLETPHVRVLIDDQGGMVSEFSTLLGKRSINAHWTPSFRSNSSAAWDESKHGEYWKNPLLYNIAGGFPCCPNFGPEHFIENDIMSAHGWTAQGKWKFEKAGIDAETGAAWALSSMRSNGCGMDLSFKKIDVVIPASPVHYTSLAVKNESTSTPCEVNAAFHNTLGAPFLQQGCKISSCAARWMTPPKGGEFDETARLLLGTDFISLSKAPLADGRLCDISEVPGIIGYTDFAQGVIPLKADLGWFSVVNTEQKLVYIDFFTGPAQKGDDDIILYFNDLWMQYGGRRYTPWSLYDGGADQNFCVGVENSVSAFASGLDYSRSVKKLAGSPTTDTILARSTKYLRYGALFAPYENNILDEGITAVEAEEDALACIKSGTWRFPVDTTFKLLKRLEKTL